MHQISPENGIPAGQYCPVTLSQACLYCPYAFAMLACALPRVHYASLHLVVCITEQSGTGRQGEGGGSGGGVLLRCVLLLAAVSTGEAMLMLYLCPTFSFIRDRLGGVTD